MSTPCMKNMKQNCPIASIKLIVVTTLHQCNDHIISSVILPEVAIVIVTGVQIIIVQSYHAAMARLVKFIFSEIFCAHSLGYKKFLII